MKVGEVKAQFHEKAFKLLEEKVKDKDLLEKYKKNVEAILNNVFGRHTSDKAEFNPKYSEQIQEKFASQLARPIRTKPGTAKRVPHYLLKPLIKLFNEKLPATKRQQKIAGKQTQNSLSATTKRIVSGEKYGPNKEWQLPKVDINKKEYKSRSIFFRDYQNKNPSQGNVPGKVKIYTETDCQNIAYLNVKAGLKPLVMNAANAKHIGGGFEFNFGTQEESLFFTTDIHPRLYALGHPEKDNRGTRYHYNTPLSHDAKSKNAPNAILVPNVNCFRKAESISNTLNHVYQECEPFSFGVFTIAGFDLRDHKESDLKLFETYGKEWWNGQVTFSWKDLQKKYQEKLELYFETAIANGYTSVPMPMLGCGAFKYKGHEEKTFDAVCEAYAAAIKKYQYCFEEFGISALGSKLSEKIMKKLGDADVEYEVLTKKDVEELDKFYSSDSDDEYESEDEDLSLRIDHKKTDENSKQEVEVNTTVSKQEVEVNATVSRQEVDGKESKPIMNVVNTTVSKQEVEVNTTVSKQEVEVNTTVSKQEVDGKGSKPIKMNVVNSVANKGLFAGKRSFDDFRHLAQGEKLIFEENQIRMTISRYIYFLLNPASVKNKANLDKPTPELCPEYFVNSSIVGLEIKFPNKDKFDNFKKICARSLIDYLIPQNLKSDEYKVVIPYAYLKDMFKFFFRDPDYANESFVNTMNNRVVGGIKLNGEDICAISSKLYELRNKEDLTELNRYPVFMNIKDRYIADQFLNENIFLWRHGKLTEQHYKVSVSSFREKLEKNEKLTMLNFAEFNLFCESHFKKTMTATIMNKLF